MRALILTLMVAFIFSESMNVKENAYRSFENILSTYVDSTGRIDYKGIVDNPYSFNQYFEFIEKVSPQSYPEYFHSKNDKIAYKQFGNSVCINAVEAVALQMRRAMTATRNTTVK